MRIFVLVLVIYCGYFRYFVNLVFIKFVVRFLIYYVSLRLFCELDERIEFKLFFCWDWVFDIGFFRVKMDYLSFLGLFWGIF